MLQDNDAAKPVCVRVVMQFTLLISLLIQVGEAEPASESTRVADPIESSEKPTTLDASSDAPLADTPAHTDSTVASPLPTTDLAAAPAPSAADAEIEKRKARAAKFGVPYIEPTASKTKNQKPSTAVQTSKPSSNASSSVPAEDPEVLAKRRAKFGIPEPVEKNKKKNGTTVPAVAQSPSPADP